MPFILFLNAKKVLTSQVRTRSRDACSTTYGDHRASGWGGDKWFILAGRSSGTSFGNITFEHFSSFSIFLCKNSTVTITTFSFERMIHEGLLGLLVFRNNFRFSSSPVFLPLQKPTHPDVNANGKHVLVNRIWPLSQRQEMLLSTHRSSLYCS